MELGRALRGAARDRALSQLCRRQIRSAPRHPIQEPRRRCPLPGGNAQVGRHLGGWPALHDPPLDHRHWRALGTDHADHPRGRHVPRPVVPHPLLAKGTVRFEGKRVAVIGTGATGVQTITEVAKTAGQLTVFQRTPKWCAPLHNGKIGKEEMAGSGPTTPRSSRAARRPTAASSMRPTRAPPTR